MPATGLGSQLSEREHSQVVGADLNSTTPASAHLTPQTPSAAPTLAELDARLAQYEQRAEEEDEEEEERIPDLQKDDMMARRTGVFHKQNSTTVTYNRFLPQPGFKHRTQVEDTTDATWNKGEGQTDGSKKLSIRSSCHRVEQQQPRVLMETLQAQSDTVAIQSVSHNNLEFDDDENEYDENEPLPDLEKDDMLTRRTGSFQKPIAAATNQSFNQFLPVPGALKYNISPVSPMKQLHRRPKFAEDEKYKESSIITMAAELHTPLSNPPTNPGCSLLGERQEKEGEKQEGDIKITSVSHVIEPISPSPLDLPSSPATAHNCKVEVDVERESVEENVKERGKEKKQAVDDQPGKKPFWLVDDDLPPMMMSRRIAFMSEDPESVSMSDMLNEEEVGHLPSLSQSRYERMHEQYNSFLEEEDHWQDDLARWKNRRRSASQELIKKEEERKKLEKRLKQEGADGNKRKSIKTYKEIVEEKERREAELCDAYRNAATPEEAAIVLQRYALRFTISDAILDSLKLPRPTSKPKAELNQLDEEQPPNSDSEISEPLHKLEPTDVIVQRQDKMETDRLAQQETSVSVVDRTNLTQSLLPTLTNSENKPPQSLEVNEAQSKQTDSLSTCQTESVTEDAQPQTKKTLPQIEKVQPSTTQAVHALPSPPSLCPRPVPLLAAKPYCQPRSTQPGHKPVKMDGLVRVNRETTENVSVTPVSSPGDLSSKQAERDISKQVGISEPMEKDEHTVKNQETEDEPPPLHTEKSTSSSGSAISSLIGGRNCIITTTIVTELTQTHVEPHHPDIQSNGQVNNTTVLLGKPAEENTPQPAATSNSMKEYSPTVTEGLEESSVTIETPILNLAKRVNHWVWDPNEERKRLERWQQEQERLLQEQYEKEQEKLKKEWEKAQLEVEEEERKHNEEERRILEETVTPLSPTGLLIQQTGQVGMNSSSPENNKAETREVPLQQNGQQTSQGNEDQHASKLHFFQDSSHDGGPSKKQELWKTSSLDRNLQLNQAQAVKRSGSHDVVSGKQSSSSTPQPPSPSRCVSGKRLCSGCSQPLGKGAAMIIDTLGLFFHIHCFKCGACDRQLGDATAGTDVRIRNGVLSCHECYIASRGRGQPTTL